MSELVLGTAQLGLPYGIANATGLPSRAEALAIVHRAIAKGVGRIDTARAYGDAESRIGEALTTAPAARVQVVTKLDPLGSLGPDASATASRKAVDLSVRTSLQLLGLPRLPVLLLHRWEHRFSRSEIVWKHLLELRAEGALERLGASVYTPAQALEALDDPDLQHLQLPFNIVDRRWIAAGVDRKAAQRLDVVIDVRSVFLQGALTTERELPTSFLRERISPLVDRLERLTAELGREGRRDLCVAYVRAQEWIKGVVIGMESTTQMDENAALFERHPLSAEECSYVESRVLDVPEDVLDPSQWRAS